MVALAASCIAASVWLMFTTARAPGRVIRLLAPETAPDRQVRAHLLRPLLRRVKRPGERRRSRQRLRVAIIELCDGMAAELAAGRTPEEAFTITAKLLHPTVAGQLPGIHPGPAPSSARTAPALDAAPSLSASTGSPTIEDLEQLARRPGAEGLRLLAACWRIGAERGGALAAVLDDLATALRDQEATRQEIATQLAGPRASARMLAGLPLVGLVFATALGADPLSFLFGTLPGLACLVLGLGLNAAGAWWTHRLARTAEEFL